MSEYKYHILCKKQRAKIYFIKNELIKKQKEHKA